MSLGAKQTSVPLPRSGRLLVCSQLWLLEVLALGFLCGEYAESAAPSTLRGWLFLQGGRVSCAASLSLLPGLLSTLLATFVRARRALALASGLLWSSTLFLVYADTRIYALFRYHFNGLVWNVLTTPGADEAVHLSTREVTWILLAFVALIPLHTALFLRLWGWTARRTQAALPTPTVARPALAWKLVLVPIMVLVAGLYARADLQRDPHVMAYARVYPLYPRLTVKRFAERWLGLEMKERPGVDMPATGILLDYPRGPLAFDERAPRPNIVVIVIDSLRVDMLRDEIMPRTVALGARGRVFRDHLSTGNATRFGLFGMLYGLHGSYWKPVYNEHRSPQLIDTLLERGYDMRFLTSASWDFPEFRSTLWVKAEGAAEDRLPSSRPGGRDDGVATRFEEWLVARPDDAQPFFSFLLLDAPHGQYLFPEEYARFQPYAESVEYLKLSDEVTPAKTELLFNRYKNSVHYADSVVGRVLDALERQGKAAETLVVVTGDHGEEFNENGFFGHTSNFTRAQVHVPFVLAGPSVPAGVEDRPTSHLDLPATLLEFVGADPTQRERWTLGANLLAPEAGRARIVSGWDSLGVHVGDAILEVPMASYGGTGIAVYDRGWQRIFDDEAVLARDGRVLGSLALECRRFLR